MNLFELTEEMQRIEYALEENGGELTEEIAAAMDITSANIRAKIDGIYALIRKSEARAKNCAEEIKRIQAIKKTDENTAKRVKEYVLAAMDIYGIDRIEGNTCKAYAKNNAESLEIDEAVALFPYQDKIESFRASLPEWLNVEIKVNKTAIKDAAKANGGITPAGCSFNRSRSLIIK